MSDIESVTLETELSMDRAAEDIASAVSGRRSIARRYVKWVRRRHPEATPADVIKLLERHYATSITAAGAAVVVGSVAADVAISMIPIVGPAAAGVKSVGAQAAKRTGKEVAKAAAKNIAKNAATSGAKKAVGLIPAGDEQLQFEITALFGLAIAEIHGLDYDKDQAQALVHGLTNERVSQQQIATMAKDIAESSPDGNVGLGRSIAAGSSDWTHWASTLSEALPGGAAQSLVRTMQTGELETVRTTMNGKQQATINYGVRALVGGVARFVFGQEVIKAARHAFPEAPDEFPPHLGTPSRSDADEHEGAPSRALAALEDAAKSTGTWVSDAAGAVGTGVSGAAGTVTRAFRSVDRDGDGVPDEPQALTAVKNVGGVVAGAAGAVGGNVAGLLGSKLRRRNRAGSETPDDLDPAEG